MSSQPTPHPLISGADDLLDAVCPVWRAELLLDKARYRLARARQHLAAVVKAQDPDRHFRGLPESPEVIAV